MAEGPRITLEAIAAELCALPPKEFTAARDARADDIGDLALAQAVRGLRKPLMAAWTVNLFARERSAELAQALELAAQLREAQEELDARSLTQLGRQRRALIRALAQQAGELATTRGERITPATADAVERTLNAAMFHAAAAAAVASGRLIRPLDPANDDPAEAAEAVAGDLDLGAPASGAPARPDELAARRARKAAERDLHDAERALAQGEREREALVRRQKAADEKAERLSDRLDELEQEITRTRAELGRQTKERDALEAGRADLEDRVGAARRALTDAKAALDQL